MKRKIFDDQVPRVFNQVYLAKIDIPGYPRNISFQICFCYKSQVKQKNKEFSFKCQKANRQFLKCLNLGQG